MTSTHLFLTYLARNLALWCLPLMMTSAMAADVADPLAPVPLFNYRSVFSPNADPIAPPSKLEDWAKANATVGQYTRGHADILRAEASQSAPKDTMDHGMEVHAHPSDPAKERP